MWGEGEVKDLKHLLRTELPRGGEDWLGADLGGTISSLWNTEERT